MCVCFLSELMFFVNVYKCVCAFVLSLHRGDTHLTKVSSVWETMNGDLLCCPATSAAVRQQKCVCVCASPSLPFDWSVRPFPTPARRSALTLLVPFLWHDLSPSVYIGVNIWQNVLSSAENTHTQIHARARTWVAKTSACCRRPCSSSSFWDISVNSSVTSWDTGCAHEVEGETHKININDEFMMLLI